MKKVFAIALAVVMLAAMGGIALAQIEPAEVNIVLPDGETATISKTVTIGDVGTVDVWGVVSADAGLTVILAPAVHSDVAANTTVSFTETIAIDSGGPKYATVTFYYGDYGDTAQTGIGNQTISVTEGDLDIKPGSFPNSINTKKNGVTPVALLGSATFDVTTVNVTTLRFGPNDAEPKHDLTILATYVFHLEDVNYDGNTDLVSHYKTKDTGIAVGQTSACLDYDLTTPVGVTTVCDSIRVIK
ncbi:hypothetical protein ACFLVV_01665 [Chloroflexota bacterium]